MSTGLPFSGSLCKRYPVENHFYSAGATIFPHDHTNDYVGANAKQLTVTRKTQIELMFTGGDQHDWCPSPAADKTSLFFENRNRQAQCRAGGGVVSRDAMVPTYCARWAAGGVAYSNGDVATDRVT